jgi:hypothetical protein
VADRWPTIDSIERHLIEGWLRREEAGVAERRCGA